MIAIKELKTIEDFEAVKVGDWLACEFNRNIHDYPKVYRFGVFKVFEVKKNDHEIILQKKNNVYFNYKMTVDGNSILTSAVLIIPPSGKVSE